MDEEQNSLTQRAYLQMVKAKMAIRQHLFLSLYLHPRKWRLAQVNLSGTLLTGAAVSE